MNSLHKLLLFIRIFGTIWMVAGRVLIFFWPVTAVLVAILLSEWEHRPAKWECRFGSALMPLAIQTLMVAWAVAALAFPILHFSLIGAQLINVAFALQMGAAAYAWHRCEGYRCFFLALLLNELWLGFWVTAIACSIIAFHPH